MPNCLVLAFVKNTNGSEVVIKDPSLPAVSRKKLFPVGIDLCSLRNVSTDFNIAWFYYAYCKRQPQLVKDKKMLTSYSIEKYESSGFNFFFSELNPLLLGNDETGSKAGEGGSLRQRMM